MDQAERLFKDYCYYRNHTASIQRIKQQKPFFRDPKPTPARLKLLAHMSAWCVSQGFSPSEWLYSLFVSRKWLYAPKLEKSHLQSDKHIPRYKQLQDYRLYRQRQRELESANAPSPSSFDPNRDLSSMAERSKLLYLETNRTQVCMLRMDTETFGYHPRSSICAKCSMSSVCLHKLQSKVDFDVLALRNGEITSQQARDQALSRFQCYDR